MTKQVVLRHEIHFTKCGMRTLIYIGITLAAADL